MLRLGFELARRGYRRYAAYPGATWAGVFTNTFFGFLIAYALLAVFEQRDTVGDYDAQDAVTYAWLAQGMLMTIYLWGWFDVALRVRSGDVATDLQRPLDFQGYSAAPSTTGSSAACRRSSSARSSSTSSFPTTPASGWRSS